MPSTEFKARLEALLELRAIREGTGSPNLVARGEEIIGISERLAAPAGDAYKRWGELVRCLGDLVRWRTAIVDAEVDADRYQRAARHRAQAILLSLAEGPSNDQLLAAAKQVVAVIDPGAIALAIAAVAAVRLPLPFVEEERGSGLVGAHEHDRPQPLRVLAFVQFFLNGRPVLEVQDVRSNLVYDLVVEVRLSSPLPADIELTPSVVEPTGVVDAPTLVLPAGCETRSAVGRLLVRIAHESLARPLEIAYGGEALNASTERPIEMRLQGQSRLVLRCVDDTHSWSGNEAVEAGISDARAVARAHGIRDSETSAFLQLFGSTAFLGADALASSRFKGDWSEEQFHAEVRRRLRQDAGIGSDLEDHPHAAGGVADLSFRRVRLELKCDLSPLTPQQACEKYGQQLVQYVVGSDRRTGVLAVLCPTERSSAPGSLHNDLASVVVPPSSGGDWAVVIGVVLVRCDLPNPSSHSR
jgi:hypothetical protein